MAAALNTRKRLIISVAAALALVAGLIPLRLAAAQQGGARSIAPACDGAPEDGFTDTGADGSALENAIDCISWYAITSGFTSDEYRPNLDITRAQMATMIAVSMRRSETAFDESSSTDHFSDDDGSTHESNINFVAEHGVVKGTGDGQYSPQEPVTRAQMATFLVNQLRVIGATVPSDAPDAFTDDEESVHEDNINTLAALDIATGTGGGAYEPGEAVTRGQMALFIARDLAELVEQDLLLPPGAVRTFVDSPELVELTEGQSPTAGTTLIEFTFDEAVADEVTVESFLAYAANGQAQQALDAQRDISDTDTVQVIFSDDAANVAVAFGVAFEAVTDSDGNGNPEGILPAPDVETAAATDAPDLIDARVERYEGSGPLPVATGWNVIYVFDEAVGSLGEAPEFAVYAQDGTRTVLTGGVDPNSGCAAGPSENEVTCTVNENENGEAATAVENAVLAGVAVASVVDADSNPNPAASTQLKQPEPEPSESPSESESPSPGPTGTSSPAPSGSETASEGPLPVDLPAAPHPEPTGLRN